MVAVNDRVQMIYSHTLTFQGVVLRILNARTVELEHASDPPEIVRVPIEALKKAANGTWLCDVAPYLTEDSGHP